MLRGDVVGRLRLIYRGLSKRRRGLWLCQCRCLTIKEVREDVLNAGTSRSCGCLSRELTSMRSKVHSESNPETPEHLAWRSMIQRCYSKRYPGYGKHGGRGIRVCEVWRNSYVAFLAHVGRRPTPQHTLDRYPDNNGNYEPGNVRWATPREQSRNMRSNRYITFNHQTMILKDWAATCGITISAMAFRLERWSVERALTTQKMRGGVDVV
jgi:hypothetical protein